MNLTMTWFFCLFLAAALCLWLLKNAACNHEVISGIVNHTLHIYRAELNLLEDNLSSISTDNPIFKSNGMVFPVSPYLRFKPRFMEKWSTDDAILMRIDCHRSYSNENCRWRIDWNCKFITYHHGLPDSDLRYAHIRALVFDDRSISSGLERLIEKIYKRTRIPTLLISRPIERVHLYYNHRFICISDKNDLGYSNLLTMLENTLLD